jgi:tetratricopeptide (TPR) repeat protein
MNHVPPRGTWFIEGKIHLASGDFASARTAFTHSLRLGEFSPARIRRLLALALLFDGDLEGAVATAHRARLDSVQGPNDVALAHYVWAIVLDRAGDPQAARVALERAFADDRRPGPDFGGSFVDARDPTSELALATVLPVHEAFYFAGIVAARRGDTLGAKRWFRAYLARPEPEAPERRLAERHLAELEDLPTRIGGQSG